LGTKRKHGSLSLVPRIEALACPICFTSNAEAHADMKSDYIQPSGWKNGYKHITWTSIAALYLTDSSRNCQIPIRQTQSVK